MEMKRAGRMSSNMAAMERDWQRQLSAARRLLKMAPMSAERGSTGLRDTGATSGPRNQTADSLNVGTDTASIDPSMEMSN